MTLWPQEKARVCTPAPPYTTGPINQLSFNVARFQVFIFGVAAVPFAS